MKDILFIEKAGVKIIYHTYQTDYVSYNSFNKLTLPKNFIRCHKSFIVNIDNISTYKKAVNNELRKLEKQIELNNEEKPENETDNWEKSLILVKENGFNFDRYNTPVIEFIYAINRLEEKSIHLKSLKTK